MSKTLKQYSTRSIALIIFYENSKALIFKVLDVVISFFIDKYVWVDVLCLQIEATLFSLHRGFGDTLCDDLSGTGIPEILFNIVSCYGFIQDNNSTLILRCRSKLVSYYLSKGFLIIEKIFSRPE